MANKSDYLAGLRAAIRQIHDCDSAHVKTVPVHEVFQGKTVWQGDVEVFDLMEHPKAKRAYAWANLDGDTTHFVTVLEVPPVKSPEDAVKASIIAEAKKRGL